MDSLMIVISHQSSVISRDQYSGITRSLFLSAPLPSVTFAPLDCCHTLLHHHCYRHFTQSSMCDTPSH